MTYFDKTPLPVITKRTSIIIAGILISGFIFMYYFTSSPIRELGGDQVIYNQIAINILNGHGFSQCSAPPFTPSIFRTPLYPAFIAAVYALFGQGNYEAIRLIQVLLMLLSSIMVFKIALMVTGNRYVAIAAMLIRVFYGYHYSNMGLYGYLITETLFIFLVNAGILVLLIIIRDNKVKFSLVLGCLLAMSMLTRPTNILLPVVIAVFLIASNCSRQTFKVVGIMLTVSYLLIVPWALRNYAQFHKFIPLSASLNGIAIFSGSIVNNPDFFPYPPNIDYTNNGFDISENRKVTACKAISGFYNSINTTSSGAGGMTVFAYNDTLRHLGLEIIREDKAGFIKRWFYRVLGHWNFADCANILNGTKTSLTVIDILKIILKLGILAVVCFAVFRNYKKVSIQALLLFPVYNTLLYTPFLSHMRYSAPSRSFIIILFAIGIFELIRLFSTTPSLNKLRHVFGGRIDPQGIKSHDSPAKLPANDNVFIKASNAIKQTIPSRKDPITIALILAIGFCYMYFFNSSPITGIGGDALVYNKLALNMLDGHGFSQCVTPPYTPSIARTPAYPAFLAAIYFIFGAENYEAVRIAQIALMLIAAFLVFKIAMLVTGNKPVSFAAFFLASIYWYNYGDSGVYGYLFTESLVILLVNGSIYLMFLAVYKKRLVYYMGLGFLLALTMLTRPSNLLFPVAAALFLVVTHASRRTIPAVALMMLVVVAAVLPWTIRNHRCFNAVIPLSLPLSGLCVYSGAVINNPDFLPYPNADYKPNGFEPTELQKKRFRWAASGLYKSFSYRGAGGMEMLPYDDTLKALGFEIIKENYFSYVKKWGFRILGHWHFADLANRLNGVHTQTSLTGNIKIALKLIIAGMVCFGIFRFYRSPGMYLLLLFPIYNTLLYTPFICDIRYSLPARSFIIILFAMSAGEIVKITRGTVLKDKDR